MFWATLFELRQSARRLLKSGSFAVLATGTLAIGIGLNAGMFAVMDALLYRPPFNVSAPDQVVRVQFRLGPAATVVGRTHYPTFADLALSGVFQTLAAYETASVSIGSGTDATLARAMLVSPDFFSVLGSRPVLGGFATATDAGGAGEGIVLSHSLWKTRFGSAENAVGVSVAIDGKPYTIAGVMPDGFQALSARRIDLWLPLEHATHIALSPREWRQNRGPFWLSVVGRLKDTTSVQTAEDRATAILQGKRAELGVGPEISVRTVSVVPGRGIDISLENRVSKWLAGVSILVLLIACSNLSNLVLSRNLAERREYFIRLTLGASRWDLVRRALADAVVIATPGTLAALLVSFVFRNSLAGLFAADVPLSRELWDPRSAGIVLASASIAFVLILTVALLQLRLISRNLLAGATSAWAQRRVHRNALLVVQSALCLTLLFAAGLFATSLKRVESLDLGAEIDRTLQVTINLPRDRKRPELVRSIYERAFVAFAHHPDVEKVALAEGSPFMSGSGAAPYTSKRTLTELWEGRTEVAYKSHVGSGFFSAVGSPTLRGRDFNDGDRSGTESVAIINVGLANHLWTSEDALGQCMYLDDSVNCIRVVGVLGGVWKFSALKRDKMTLYLPLGQFANILPGALFVRPTSDAADFIHQARVVAQSMDPDLPAVRVMALREIVEPEFRPWRLGSTVFGVYALIALAITTIGMYGVVAASTRLRLKEIGIRTALGAHRRHVVRVVVGESVLAVATGLTIGGLLSLFASRWLGGVLFQTSPRDPGVLLQSILVLFVFGAMASAVPTFRALRVNTTNLLRSE